MNDELQASLTRLVDWLSLVVLVAGGWLTADLVWLLIDMKERLI